MVGGNYRMCKTCMELTNTFIVFYVFLTRHIVCESQEILFLRRKKNRIFKL